ncbi:MAG: hypothetical protein ABR598_09345 [Candidatus Dormibacteria bacterium]
MDPAWIAAAPQATGLALPVAAAAPITAPPLVRVTSTRAAAVLRAANILTLSTGDTALARSRYRAW